MFDEATRKILHACPREALDESLFSTSPIITRYPDTILSRHDVPYPAALTFNAGVVKTDDRYIMIFRNDYGSFEEERIDGTNLGLAFSDDGIKWKVEPEPCFAMADDEVLRVYDPRITVLEDRYILCFAVDTKHGVRGGIAETKDLKHFEVLSMSVPENRNMVLFPEKINGNYVRLERPMPVYGRDGMKFDIFLSESPDLVYWGKSRLVMGVEHVPFANEKIGPGAPPIKTDKGWIMLFHAVDFDPARGKNGWEPTWKKRYTIGVALLDLKDPSKVIGMYKRPLMIPEGYYELEQGYRTNALFPCAALVDEGNVVRIYYSAGDCIIRMATCDLDELIGLCTEPL